MRPTILPRLGHRAAVISALALTLAACSGSGDPSASTAPGGSGSSEIAAAGGTATTRPRPELFADLPAIQLLAPAELGAGRAPTFEWAPFADAATYRLSVLAPDAPTWAWLGSDTSVRYGGVPEGVGGPSLRPGSWWSVAALGSDGTVVAMSDLRAVSPADDRGPAPAWAADSSIGASGEGAVAPATTAPVASPSPASDAGPIGARACDLLTGDEITSAIKGQWEAPSLSTFGRDASWCEWRSVRGSVLSVSIGPAKNYDPDGWGADETLDGLGERAYRVNHGWDRRIGFVHGAYSVMMTIDYTRVDVDGYRQLAGLIDGRLP
jgi:hypothetical protein